MKPTKFKESNVVYAKDQPEYQPLPVFKSEEGICVSCWKLSFFERLRILFTGKLWCSMMTFNRPLTPVLFSTKKSEVFVKGTRIRPKEWTKKHLEGIKCFIKNHRSSK